MPIGVTLAEMSTQTRAVLGYSLNPAFGIDQEQSMREGLRRTQHDLWIMYDWPMLITQVKQPIQKGSRFAMIPSDLDFEHINTIFARSEPDPMTIGGSWIEMTYGIGPDQYNEINSDLKQTGFPVKRYQATASDNDAVEIWPIPNNNCQLLFVGRVSLKPLVQDTDVCTLDSDLIIATYAAQMMARNGNADAEMQIAKANQIMNRLRARQTATKRKPFISQGYLSGGVF